MSSISSQKPCVTNNASSNYFANYSGTYTYNFASSLSGATIKSITFTADTHYLQTSMKGSYHIAILSSSADTTGTQVTDSISFSHNSSSTKKSIVGTVWTVTDTSVFNKFLSGEVIFRLVRTSSTSGTVRMYYGGTRNNTSKGLLTCNIEYVTPTLTSPTILSISQNMDGTYTINWSAATGSNGTGNVTYMVYSVSDGSFISSFLTSLSYTGTIGEYNYNCQFRVYAYYGSLSTYSATASKTFYPPSLSTPTLTATINADTSLKLTWTAATLSYTTGNVAYSVYVGSNVYSSGLAATTITVPAATLEGWGTGDYVFNVVATATSLSNTSQGSTLSKTSGTYTYSYVAPVTAKTIAYYNGSSWVNCEVYYYNGSSWVLCEPHYYDGTKWVACSTV